MTETRRWLEARRRELARWVAGAGMLLTVGLILGILAGGVILARLGFYQRVPVLVLVAWLGVLGTVGWGLERLRRKLRRLGVMFLAEAVERAAGRRRGSIAGVAAWDSGVGSASLASLADGRAASWLADQGSAALRSVRRQATASARVGALLFVAGAVVFATSGPGAPQSAALWRPLSLLTRARGPVVLTVDRTQVRRGDSVVAAVTAAGRRSATLWVRGPGEPWSPQSLVLDTAGRAAVVLGPLESDRYLRASSGGRSSETLHVEVALPAFLAELQLLARYPRYLELADEPLAPGGDPILVPVATRILTRGRATVNLANASWQAPRIAVPLSVDGEAFSGSLVVRQSGRWRLAVAPQGGGLLEGAPPELQIIAVSDSVPVVTVPIPGADTTAPLSLRQPLLIDARDDHHLTSVEVSSWRVSRLGVKGPPVVQSVPLPEGGTDRAVLHWTLDLNERGFLPGDTAYFQVKARDNAPAPQVGASPLYALRLPAMWELRRAMRDASRAAAAGADSLVAAQQELARSIEDFAAERERGAPRPAPQAQGANRSDDQLPFSSVERARELLEQEDSVLARARELREQIQELAQAAWAAGLTDPEFHRQLRELQDLLERALTDEFAERLDALREALERLDAPGVREALRELAESAQELREELERGRELFERAALEGEMTTIAEDAEELARQQREWNEAAQQRADSSLAALEEALAEHADSLAAELAQLDAALDSAGAPVGDIGEQQRRASEAARQMWQAASGVRQGDMQRARRSGEAASEALDPMAETLRQERDAMREAWREEVLAALDRAMVETAGLANRQEEITARLNRGESGADVRGSQAAMREGVDRILQRLQSAAGRNALVSPRLGTALGLAKIQMNEALDQLQRPSPNSREAAEAAGQSLDALNALIYALLQTRSDVAGAQSGSGLQEALERMAQLADQQGALNGQTGGLLSMLPVGGQQLMRELQAIAERQRALAAELERLNAAGELSGADALAEEAREIARELESGRLDREIIDRQERLFRRLLDAGRTLERDEEDERKERVSETADPRNVRLPPAGVLGERPRFRFPTWEELRSLSPRERRLILDYFRRLNEARP
ncbi:MAG: hypothetical protein GTN62_02165 [Gemmatimonadales bacterium]|nr:hypothetical protein [Gemmatimonadales bacterium]NIN12369.1 hypothetical protein [Gemmatimonadales bacterium]NIN48907.1 hypothetical protein [Gemmatimonadales bacterium]NIP06371.1 hypothetical protein [Gemmatimonadales bacterium]NIR00744.1 hypothetical protein [Gemmatimonadales bacterium]